MTGNVDVLLSTYNGARFLPEQLRSLTDQTHDAWRLLWRDDGSDDDSRAILDAFAESQPAGRVSPLGNDGVHRGIASSFLTMIRRRGETEAVGLVAFADQDDVWLPEKLARGVLALDAIPSDTPALYCARQMLVDQRLRTLAPSPAIRRPPSFPASLAQNIATGCTVMLNAAACQLLASVQAPDNTLHDWWAYIVVSAAGGHVLVDGIPTVLYRQHGLNAVGAARSRLRRAAVALRRGPAEFMTLLRAHVATLQTMGDRLTPHAVESLQTIEAALRGSLAERARLLRAAGFDRQTLAETLAFDVWFLFG